MEALVGFILCWLVLTAAVGTLVRHVVHRRDRLRDRLRRHPRKPSGASPHPLCARCGYPAHGLPHHRCPECGADLRVSGVEHAPRD